MEPIKYENRLRECRLDAGLRQRQVVELLGLASANRLSHWENGLAEPNLKNLLKLSRIYNMDVELLYPIADGKPPRIISIITGKQLLRNGREGIITIEKRVFERRDGTLELAPTGNGK
jgi:transcriptional regulator with XRE-family HTH domain